MLIGFFSISLVSATWFTDLFNKKVKITGNVVVLNHTEQSKLETERLLWDQNTQYFFSEKAFILSTLKDTVYGIGFECKEDLSMHLAKKTIGNIITTEK